MDLTGFLTENIYSVHLFLAGLAGSDVWRLEKEEADELGTAVQGVARHYAALDIDAKVVDWLRLARTLGMVYGTRLVASGAFARRQKAAPSAPSSPGEEQVAPAGAQAAKTRDAPAGMMWASPGHGLPDVLVPHPGGRAN